MIGGVTGFETADSLASRPQASVATVSDIGPRRVNEDRALAVVSDDDGSWVIAVADGLGGHTRGRRGCPGRGGGTAPADREPKGHGRGLR